MNLNNKQKAVLGLIVANIIWGIGSPVFKWSLFNVHPFTLAFLRFFIGTLIIFPFAHEHLKILKRDIPTVILMAFFGITLNISFYFLALTYTQSINAPIIGSSAPIFIMVLSLFTLRERIKFKTMAGLLIGFLGIVIVVAQPLLHAGVDGSILGNLLLVFSTLAGSIHMIIAKKLSERYEPTVVTFYLFLLGCIGFLPFLFLEINQYGFLMNLTGQGAIGILYGAIFSSVIAYVLQQWGLSKISATEVGLFTYIDPLATILVAIPLLGEVPSSTFLVGSFLVFLGIFIAEGRIHYHPFHKLKT